MASEEKKPEVTHLKCREIQAPLVSALLEGFAKEFGLEKTLAVAKEIICKDAVLSGQILAEKYSGNSLNELLRIVEEVWATDGTMEIANLQLSEDSLKFDVTRCGYAEMYERLGVKELGTLLSCCRDFAFMDGFNPEIELLRTKTIMDGDDICDFCYVPKKGKSGSS
jgi:hypothetical protein